MITKRELMEYGIAIALILMLITVKVDAAESALNLDEISSGSLLGKDDKGQLQKRLPLQNSRIEMTVTGPILRAVIEQTFVNPGKQWQEAVYAFPLPEQAAVDHLQIQLGSRRIEGLIREKRQARKIYQAARQQGKRAALLQQYRPNLFTTSVANIPPGESVRVRIEYQQPVIWDRDRFRFRLPLAITPRYQAVSANDSVTRHIRTTSTLSGGWSVLPGEIETVVTRPEAGNNPDEAEDSQQVEIRIQLNAGFPLKFVRSPSHRILSHATGEMTFITLADTRIPADRDFVLEWKPQSGHQPAAAFFTEHHDSGDYGLLMLMPPDAESRTERFARDVMFVIDTSGSMSGISIRQAKAALSLAIGRLKAVDSFNVIRFDSTAERLFAASRPANSLNKAAAQSYVDQLQARGGTEILPAMKMAFSADTENRGQLRQVVFITDGAVNNEAEILEFIRNNVGDSRLFTVGIGSAPNSYFMTESARFGRGSYRFIARPDEVSEKMQQLFEKLEQPVLGQLQLQLPVESDVLPDPLPDLYAGEPLVVIMKLSGIPDHVLIQGRQGKNQWQHRISLSVSENEQQTGLSVYWAREKIRYWMRQKITGTDASIVRENVIEVALAHHLVSPYTSLVAVDVMPVKPEGKLLERQVLPLTLPAGMTSVTRSAVRQIAYAQGATGSVGLMQKGLALLLLVLLSVCTPSLIRIFRRQ